MKSDKINIRILVNDRLETVPAVPIIVGDTSKAMGDPFTGVVLGAVQFAERKWKLYDMVTGHCFHNQRKTYRSPKQGLKAVEKDVLTAKFKEGMTLKEIAEKAWLFSWYGGLPLLSNKIAPHLPAHIVFGEDWNRA